MLVPVADQTDVTIALIRFGKRLWHLAGIDAAIFYTLFGKGWAIFANLLSLLLIARYLTRDEQGFYYTFLTLVAARVFMELGLSYVLIQVAGHESATLNWTVQGTLEGSPAAKSRLASLVRQVLQWYAVVAVATLGLVLSGGSLFFHKYQGTQNDVRWMLPWALLCCASAISILVIPVFAVLEGCGLVSQLARVRAIEGVFGSAALWLGLIFNARLYAAAFVVGATLIVDIVWLFATKVPFLKDVFSTPIQQAVHWGSEVWPFQWRVALSWLGGYFIFQVFNPLAFAFFGAKVAGQFGMTITALQGMLAVAMTWLTTKMAPMARLIALKLYDELDRIFFRSLIRATAVQLLGYTSFLSIAFYLNDRHLAVATRLLDMKGLILFSLATLCNFFWSAFALYLRAHKREPYMVLSITSGLVTSASAAVMGKAFGPDGMAWAFFIVSAVLNLVVGIHIFRTCRAQWHLEADAPC